MKLQIYTPLLQIHETEKQQLQRHQQTQRKIKIFLKNEKIGYESNGTTYETKKNEKQNDEKIYYVQHDLLLHEYEQLP